MKEEINEWDVGDMFDPADWPDEDLREYFPTRCEEFIKLKYERIAADPSYYGIAESKNN